MDARTAADRWAATWQRAWEALEADPILALYADDAFLSTAPFREPYVGREGIRSYVERVFGEEEDPRVWVGALIVDGDRAAIPWWAAFREEDADVTLAGTSVLRFDADGLVVEQWDAWNAADERLEPPTSWSPFADRDTQPVE